MEKEIKFKPDSTLIQQCYAQLQNDIIEGILRPGQKLKVIQIKQRFNIGQSPIREALSRLVSSGLVEFTDNKGFRVAKISESDVRDTYAIFTNIESYALSLSIQHGNDEWEANVISTLHRLSLVENKKEIDYQSWVERNYDFHVALISACKSPILLDIRKNLYKKFDRYCRMAFKLNKEPLSFNHEEHKKLANSVLKRDVKQAQDLMTFHINGALENVIKKLKASNLI